MDGDDEEPEDYAPDPRDYYSHFYRESERLETFHDWPPWAHVNKNELAKNGFMYLHVSDRVQCVFCRASLGSFKAGDVVANEHRKYCPECPFAFGYECGNIPIPSSSRVQQATQNVQPLIVTDRARPAAPGHFAYHFPNRAVNEIGVPQSHSETSIHSSESIQEAAAVITEPKYRDWADGHTRLRSYRGWPAQMRQTPRDLAAAGLLYMGQGDRCKCCWCGGELHGWEPDDDPWVEHAKWFPQCGFVRQQMGVAYVRIIKNGERANIESSSNQAFLRRPHVLAALNDYEYTQEQVLEAFHTYGVLNLVNTRDIRKYVEELTSKRQAAQTQARLAESLASTNPSLSSHLVNRSDSSVAMTDRGQLNLRNIESPCIQDFLRRPHVLVALNEIGYSREQVLEALCTFGALKLSTIEYIVTYVEDLRERRQVWSVRGQPIMHPSDQVFGSTVSDERRQVSNR